MNQQRVAILGAGLAGLSAANHLHGWDCQVYDQNPYYGGHAHSWNYQGFLFDEGPHSSFTKDQKVRNLFSGSVEGQFREFQPEVYNYFYGHLLKHPAQTNLYGLPEDLIKKCIDDLAFSQSEPKTPPVNYAEWCYQSLGRTFSEEFTFRYTRKYWTLDPEAMSVDWVGQRVYSPSLDEVKYGATTPSTNNDHYYIQRSRYPLKGGFWSYTHSLAQGLNLHLGHKAAEIDLHRKRISFHDGGTEDYQHLISSIPLPELVRIIKDAPSAVDEAASQLSCSSIVIVNIGLRGELPHRYHWMYFYDDDILFSRVAFPHMFSPNNAPQGHSSIQAEVYFSHYRPLPAENILERVITDLGKTGIIHDAADIVFAEEELVEYGNVIFDHHRSRNVAIIREFLEENGVLTCGRYGEWAYLWTDQAVISGEKAAKQLGLELAE